MDWRDELRDGLVVTAEDTVNEAFLINGVGDRLTHCGSFSGGLLTFIAR